MECVLKKDTLERAGGLFCCNEMYQRKFARILERRNIGAVVR